MEDVASQLVDIHNSMAPIDIYCDHTICAGFYRKHQVVQQYYNLDGAPCLESLTDDFEKDERYAEFVESAFAPSSGRYGRPLAATGCLTASDWAEIIRDEDFLNNPLANVMGMGSEVMFDTELFDTMVDGVFRLLQFRDKKRVWEEREESGEIIREHVGERSSKKRRV